MRVRSSVRGLTSWSRWSSQGHGVAVSLLTATALVLGPAILNPGGGASAEAAERGQQQSRVLSVAAQYDVHPRFASITASATTVTEADPFAVIDVRLAGSTRLNIDAGGNVGISGNNTLFLNFGDEARAQQFLAQRLSQGFEGTTTKSFDVPTSYVNSLVSRAAPESMARSASVFEVDATKTAGSYGLRSSEFPGLMCAIDPGSAC